MTNLEKLGQGMLNEAFSSDLERKAFFAKIRASFQLGKRPGFTKVVPYYSQHAYTESKYGPGAISAAGILRALTGWTHRVGMGRYGTRYVTGASHSRLVRVLEKAFKTRNRFGTIKRKEYPFGQVLA